MEAHKVETDSKLTNGSQSFEDEYNKTKSMSYKQISAFYKGKDIPALQEEPYIDNIDNYKGSIQHELERVRYPDQPVKDYTLTWEGVANTIFKDESFGKELNEKDFLLEDVKTIIDKCESQTRAIKYHF